MRGRRPRRVGVLRQEIRLDGFSIGFGRQNGGLFDLIKDTKATVTVVTGDASKLDGLRSLRTWGWEEGRVEILEDGSTYWKELLLPQAVRTGITDDPTGWQGWILFDEMAFGKTGQKPNVSVWTYKIRS